MRPVRLAGMRARRRQRRAARDAELDRQDRAAAARMEGLTAAPLFSQAAPDGACPGCGGRGFRPLETAGDAVMRGFLAGGVVGSIAAVNQGFTECVTCGKIFRKG